MCMCVHICKYYIIDRKCIIVDNSTSEFKYTYIYIYKYTYYYEHVELIDTDGLTQPQTTIDMIITPLSFIEFSCHKKFFLFLTRDKCSPSCITAEMNDNLNPDRMKIIYTYICT